MTENIGFRFGDLLHGEAETGILQVPNLTDSLYDAIWRRIVNLEFAAGSRLSDDTLARQFGVSRTPVREALYRLSQVGLIEVNARRGFFVTKLDGVALAELFDLRAALEMFNAQIAAPLISPEELEPPFAELEIERARATESTPEDAERFVKTDLRLHHLLLDRVANTRLLRALDEHAVILDALREGDVMGTAQAMRVHIQNVKERSLIELGL